VINIGSGEGSYAVGYARSLPGVWVHAYDTDVVARQRLRSLARLNNVEARVSVRAFCDCHELQLRIDDNALVVSDCEGCERTLLDPEAVPQLAATDILVELHDFIQPGTTDEVTGRFSSTHSVTLIRAKPREDADMPPSSLPREEAVRVMWEGRPTGMNWAWLQAHRPGRLGRDT
jgi:hypothetical protein